MENGKGGIVHNLKNGVGFGSTEFHILRPVDKYTNSYWIYYVTSFEQFRLDAAGSMTGSSGHRRVPEDFLNNFLVGRPPYDQQLKFADYVKKREKKLDKTFIKLGLLKNTREQLLNQYFE